MGRLLMAALAAAVFAAAAGASDQPSRIASGPACNDFWGPAFCVGVRPGRVVLSVSQGLIAHAEVYRTEDDAMANLAPLAASGHITGSERPAWLSRTLRPGTYFVRSSAVPDSVGYIAIYVELDCFPIRVPPAATAHHVSRPTRRPQRF